jgi:ADP-ribosylglycohydrolase
MKQLPSDYEERVYAGVLGKIIGVYMGRPFEGWTYQQIIQQLGEIDYYIHEKFNVPLIVTDDDISGTFTFIRAMPDYGNTLEITPAQIGQTWLNYLVENRTILWWGGFGNSTEHTAYIRLKNGIQAPKSGSMAMNSKAVAEQIGAQIFIDGWAMIVPGNPEKAADLAKRASSVSHDGEAIYGAQVLAAMESLAFIETDLNRLLDSGVAQIPHDSVIYRMITDLRDLRGKEGDWHKARQFIEEDYGYDRYGGNCHIVPNHALIILSLLYGDNEFQKTLKIVNTCGWDTDCNSGNVGCLMGIKNGLSGLEAGADFRTPVSDRLYIPTADGGRAISDALTESYHIINIGRALANQDPVAPKNGARFSFNLPGSIQGFREEDNIPCKGTTAISNSFLPGSQSRVLKIQFTGVASGREARVGVDTFIPQPYAHLDMHYEFLASPTLYSGQTVHASVMADKTTIHPINAGLYIRYYGAGDELFIKRSPVVTIQPGETRILDWQIPDLHGEPIAQVGIEITSEKRADGILYLDYLTWDGTPEVNLTVPDEGGSMWRRAWVNAVDIYSDFYPETYRLIQNHGLGMIIQGCRDWKDYTVEAKIIPHLAKNAGLGFRVQGMERYYALLLGDDNKIRLIKKLNGLKVLAERDFAFAWDDEISLKCMVRGSKIQAWVNSKLFFEVNDQNEQLSGGAVSLIVEEGRICSDGVQIHAPKNKND